MTSRDRLHDRCHFIPPWLVERIDAAQAAMDAELRARREALSRGLETGLRPSSSGADRPASTSEGLETVWTVHDAGQGTRLPGTPVRTVGDPESGDVAVDEAAVGITETLAMFAEGLGRASYDGAGAPVLLTVHYGRDYDNAFWDGEHLVFGDGDGEVFERFTKPVDVLAHEFVHAVTEHTAGLVYRGQPGALNESVSDVFSACLKQRVLGQDAASADWLVGEGIFTASIQARALRDMANPGTAFDDPRLGKDPQVGHMDHYVETSADNGGVHLNSGIPNRAFHLAAVAIGGSSLEGAGQVWYDALTGGDVGPDTDFAGFAAATIRVAGDHADAVRTAWAEVGVTTRREDVGEPPEGGAPLDRAGVVRVTRSGGFIGRSVSGSVALRDADPTLRELVVRCQLPSGDLAGARGGLPKPDMFVYTFEVGGQPPVEVPEQHLTDDLRELAQRVLETGGDHPWS